MIALLVSIPVQLAQGAGDDSGLEFERDVRPILQQACFECHGEKTREGDLDLRTRDALLRGGESGHAIVPGRPEDSLLLKKIVSGEMPPRGPKLTLRKTRLIERWLETGALLKGEDADAARRKLTALAVTEADVLVNVFHTHCTVCHGKWKKEAGLDLRTRASILKGGKSGPALVPGKPERSLVLKRIVTDEMPPKKNIFGDSTYVIRVPVSGIEKLRTWIARGAPADGPASVARIPAGGPDHDPQIDPERLDHWAFQPPGQPAEPEVQHADRVRNPVDAFLLRRLEAKGLSLSRDAERLTLLRRATFALTGLAPEPTEVEAVLNDARADWYERLIDRLLDSRHYGERQAVYWLDAAGYADTHGQINRDEVRRYLWRYRDYVIRSFNDDKPYDRFLLEQIAGDELFDYRAVKSLTAEQLDALIATGFLRTGTDGTDEGALNKIANRHAVIDEQIDIFSTAVMGLTLECARCHSHKFDPIPQRDYYRFAAIFRAAYDPYDWRIPNAVLYPPRYPVADHYQRYINHRADRETPEARRFNDPIRAELAKLQQQKDALAGDKVPKELLDAISRARGRLLSPMRIHALTDTGGEPTPVFVLRRGEIHAPGQRVEPGVPVALTRGLEPYQVKSPGYSTRTSGRRLALARWLIQPEHPLTARVFVNRVWHQHFGRGLVTTTGNFGRKGARPSHPELLDWLATRFVRDGWSIKSLHRLIMSSTAWRQRSIFDAARHAADPDNVLLSRFPFRRLDAEAIRDSLLQVAGRLDRTPFGPAVDVTKTEAGEFISIESEQGLRRSVYVIRRRLKPVTLLELFDQPAMVPNCVSRTQSTVATQALQLYNSELVRRCSQGLAQRILDAEPDHPNDVMRRVYLTALSRRPTDFEADRDTQALSELQQRWKEHLSRENKNTEPGRAWQKAVATYCHTILNSPEFIYID